MAGIKLYIGIWLGLVFATVMEVVVRSLPGSASLFVLIIMLISSNTANSLNVSRGLGWFLCLLAAVAFGVGGFLNYRQAGK